MLGVAPPKGADDPKVDPAWAEFVKRVWSWSDDLAPKEIPEVGDAAVFTRFLDDGVWRAMGGGVSMKQLMVYEFGHAPQLQQGSLFDRMSHRASVSSIRNSDDGGTANGVVGSMPRWRK